MKNTYTITSERFATFFGYNGLENMQAFEEDTTQLHEDTLDDLKEWGFVEGEDFTVNMGEA